MTATSKHSGGPSTTFEAVLACIALGAAVTVVATLELTVRLARTIDGGGRGKLPGNPVNFVGGLARGKVAWPASGTEVLVALLVVAAVASTIVAVTVQRRRGSRSRVDRAARRMGRGRDIAPISGRQAAATAKRLGVDAVGIPLGRTVAGNQPLWMRWEDVLVDISGPRTGKTTCGAIPAILAAPGSCVVTSNKRDVIDATRGPRAAIGRVWTFDPQQIVEEPRSWWWNPLSYVTNGARSPVVQAQVLAGIFTSAGRDPGARTDAFFDTAGPELLAGLLLAAAIDGKTLEYMYRVWLTKPTNDEPALILREAGYGLPASALQEVVNAPEKQRAGVYGTAKQVASFCLNDQAMAWVTPRSAGETVAPREFSPQDFVANGRDTLYSVSREGIGSAGPLVTALTVAVMEAAEALANKSPGGRLRTPLVAVLDEAANVCKWSALPSLYSHYGSKGICVLTFLQSWSQGVEVWGRDGMKKLWSSANVKVYGGGVSEGEWLDELSKLIGDYDLTTTSISYGQGGRSTNRSVRPDRTLDTSELAALPAGRAIVLASGARPVLVRRLPWYEGPRAAEVTRSITTHDPNDESGEQTARDAFGEPSDKQRPEQRNPWVTRRRPRWLRQRWL